MGILLRHRVVATVLLAVLTLAVVGCGEEEKGPFRIGVMESVTGAGETYGTVAVQSKQLAVDEINEAGGINGRMLELIVEDSKCNAQDAITAYNKLTDVDGVKIILGTSCSGAMLGAAPLAEKEGVVMFSGLATNPDIAEAGDYIFRTSLSDATVGVEHGQRALGRRRPQPGDHQRIHRLRRGRAANHDGAVREAGRSDRSRGELPNRHDGLQDPVEQAPERQPGCGSRGLPG